MANSSDEELTEQLPVCTTSLKRRVRMSAAAPSTDSQQVNEHMNDDDEGTQSEDESSADSDDPMNPAAGAKYKSRSNSQGARFNRNRRFTLNPLIFAKQQRDLRRQSLSQLKLSYYKNPFDIDRDQEDGVGVCGWILTGLSWLMIVCTFPISTFFCLKIAQEYERVVIFRLGRLLGGGAKGPGIFFVLPCIETFTKVDLRTVSFDVPPQEILTKDSVTVSVDAVVYYRVANATVSVANVENAHHSTRLLAQTTLRNMLGTRSLSEILSDRETLANAMQAILDEATDNWGIKVERVELKDVRLPVMLQRAMAAEAEASREARAKVIAADGEQKASRSLRDAADMIVTAPGALHLRYLQTMKTLSGIKNHTIIFPVPVDIIQKLIARRMANRKKHNKIKI